MSYLFIILATISKYTFKRFKVSFISYMATIRETTVTSFYNTLPYMTYEGIRTNPCSPWITNIARTTAVNLLTIRSPHKTTLLPHRHRITRIARDVFHAHRFNVLNNLHPRSEIWVIFSFFYDVWERCINIKIW